VFHGQQGRLFLEMLPIEGRSRIQGMEGFGAALAGVGPTWHMGCTPAQARAPLAFSGEGPR
jgi:hypothetical protein